MSDRRTRVRASGGEKREAGKWRRRTKRGTGKKSETLLKIPQRRGEIIARRHSVILQRRLCRRLNISGHACINICKIMSADAVEPNFSYTQRIPRATLVLPTRRWGALHVFYYEVSKLTLLFNRTVRTSATCKEDNWYRSHQVLLRKEIFLIFCESLFEFTPFIL